MVANSATMLLIGRRCRQIDNFRNWLAADLSENAQMFRQANSMIG